MRFHIKFSLLLWRVEITTYATAKRDCRHKCFKKSLTDKPVAGNKGGLDSLSYQHLLAQKPSLIYIGHKKAVLHHYHSLYGLM